MFDQMFSYVRYYNSACMMQASPVVFHSVMMSILFHHYKQLMELAGKKEKANPVEWPSRFQKPPWQAKLEGWSIKLGRKANVIISSYALVVSLVEFVHNNGK